jgi:hypothetical protein
MVTITKKQMAKLVKLANAASRAALVHDRAQKAFCSEFERVTGAAFDCTKTGCEDPIVDIIDYGTAVTDIEDLTQLINEYQEDIGSPVLIE